MERDVEITPEGKEPLHIGVEVAFQYTDTANVTELAFANTINTPGRRHPSDRPALGDHRRYQPLCA